MVRSIVEGALVKAILGREKNENFIVIKLDLKGKNVYLVNGKQRKLVNPKKKNIKHIVAIFKDVGLAEKIKNNIITDADIIKTLKDYKSSKKI